jgi:Zn-dependent peptidase ImmA (M78 family)
VLLDYATIIYRAAWVRHRAKLIGRPPPYSMRHIMETVFPHIPVAGDNLPKGVTEMAIRQHRHRALFYTRKVNHAAQRTGLAHGLYHHLSDLKAAHGIRECSLPKRKLGMVGGDIDPVELACDLFAAELLIPLDVLHQFAPDTLGTGKHTAPQLDEIDSLSSRFNVPAGFMRWRLHDLYALRRSHYNTDY